MRDEDPIFKYVFGGQWEQLPIVIRKHYSIRPNSDDVVKMTGTMKVDYFGIFYLLLPILRLLKILVPYKGNEVPVEVRLFNQQNTKALNFERTFYFPGRQPYHFCSQMVPLEEGDVVEYIRFGIGLRMHFHFDGEKVMLQHRGYVWNVFGYLIPLPLTLFLGKMTLIKYARAEDSFHLEMDIHHFLFGKIYEYVGEFKITS